MGCRGVPWGDSSTVKETKKKKKKKKKSTINSYVNCEQDVVKFAGKWGKMY